MFGWQEESRLTANYPAERQAENRFMRIDNPDELPYYVREGERRVQVRFAPLAAEDEAVINDKWTASIFFALWQYLAHNEQTRQTTLKLITGEEQEERILGLLRLGADNFVRADPGKLNTHSVLETAPHFQYRSRERSYKGVGKVLVARLIAESVLQGHGGTLVVTPRPQTSAFYRHLGFRPQSRDPKRFFIRDEPGMQLLDSVLLGREDA